MNISSFSVRKHRNNGGTTQSPVLCVVLVDIDREADAQDVVGRLPCGREYTCTRGGLVDWAEVAVGVVEVQIILTLVVDDRRLHWLYFSASLKGARPCRCAMLLGCCVLSLLSRAFALGVLCWQSISTASLWRWRLELNSMFDFEGQEVHHWHRGDDDARLLLCDAALCVAPGR